jgi:hypothetical protein
MGLTGTIQVICSAISLLQTNYIPMSVPYFKTFIGSALFSLATFSFSACTNQPEQENKTGNAPTDPAKAEPALTNFHWLNGKWQQITKAGIIFENWQLEADGSMTGSSGFIKGKDTMAGESILLVQKGNDVLYIPTVKGQNNDEPIPFTLSVSTADSFVFVNPGHDYPDKIVYKKFSDDSMVATISGKPGGKEQSEIFAMKRLMN